MKIIGQRVLLEKVEKENDGGFETVAVIDDFISRGRVVQVGSSLYRPSGSSYSTGAGIGVSSDPAKDDLAVGNVILFAKFSPDTQEVTIEGKPHKVVAFTDIIAIEEYA